MSKVFIVDIAKCNGCYGCQIACKDEHCETDWRPYAASQPDIGQFWMRVDEKTRGQIPVVRVSYTPTFCAHCADAPCEAACAEGAFKRRDDGLLLIDPDICSGCGSCVKSCPQGSIYFNDELGLAQKCTGCAHLLDNGWQVPRCVDVCSHDAILYMEESEVADLLADAEFIEGLAGFGPRVYYRNLPKRFVAGSAIDFVADEVVIGAKVLLLDGADRVAEQTTDWYGDFKFDQVAPADYRVAIEMDGYARKEASADVREIDLFIGEIGLDKV
ncbi:MAG TPA: oxidoreductase [Coriobacteriia bacterium]|nr:oxidoreductase [Coriobacteriia bacterium]